jgi:nucleoside-diphosphate-sugar epimerase
MVAAALHDLSRDRSMDIVITGASGLIGQHLLRSLAPAHTLWGISRSTRPEQIPSSVRWVTADLTTAEFVTHLPARADAVVHLAQSAHYREFPERALDVFAVNVESTARLLDWSVRAGVAHFVLASTGGGSEAATLSHYVASKRAAELLVGSYAGAFRTLVLRFFFVYGPGQKPWMLVPRLIESIRTGSDVPIAGGHGPRLNPIHVDDAVRALTLGLERSTEGVLDIAGPEVVTIRAMGEAIAAHLNTEAKFVSDATIVANDLVGDITAMSARLIPPSRRFGDGVGDMLVTTQGHLR